MSLDGPIENATRITPVKKRALYKLGLRTVRDMLYYFPFRYVDFACAKKITDLVAGELASVIGELTHVDAEKTWKKKMNLAEGTVRDDTGAISVVWFNQPYIARVLKPGTHIMVSGRVSIRRGEKYFANPKWEIINNPQPSVYNMRQSTLVPVYSETYGVSSEWIRWQIKKVLNEIRDIPELIPPDILKKYHLPGIRQAIRAAHSPKNLAEAEVAKKRFSFEEIFFIQLDRQKEKKKNKENRGAAIRPDESLVREFKTSLPFSLTSAQERVLQNIFEDFEKPYPMSRLLEGDVGSGKTVIAAFAALAAVKSGYQAALMAPTEILARQHFEEFMRRLKGFRISVALLTSAESKKFPSKISFQKTADISKNQLLKYVASGDIQILIGTHALIQDRVRFKKLGFVVIDEQHRFGTEQRARLAKKKKEIESHRDSLKLLKKSQIGYMTAAPHLLSMTATPIPRTLALTVHGDLDLSVLDEMPPGRKKIITHVVSPKDREKTYEFIRSEIEKGRQTFVVCPRIEPTTNPSTRLGVSNQPLDAARGEQSTTNSSNFTDRRQRLKL